MKKSIRIATALLIAGAVLGAVSAGLWRYLDTPAGPEQVERYVEIPSGTAFIEVARILEREGIIRGVRRFRWLAWLKGTEKQIKAGDYTFHPAMKPAEVLDRLVKGESQTVTVTIPEGYTMGQIAHLLQEKGLADAGSFLSLASDERFVQSLGIHGVSLEGFLFPDTYRLSKGMGEKRIMQVFVARFQAVFKDEYRTRLVDLRVTLEELVTLASIIEKETADPAERHLISAVLHNRLKRGMMLQSDPTVIYGMKDFRGNLTSEDLQKEHPYNTYLVKGLPPQPIANPGEASLKAALFPSSVPYMFFVSKNNGTHHFSTTLEEHERAVNTYQRKR